MIEAIKKRRSIRKYKNKPVEDEKIKEILKAAMFAPTAMNLREWRFVVVKNKEIIRQLSKSTMHSSFSSGANVVIVVCGDESISPKWWQIDCAIAAENIYLEAQNQGLGSCMIQIYQPNSNKAEDFVRGILKLKKNIRVLCLMAIGYPDEQKNEHNDKEFEKSKVTWIE